MRKGRAQGWMVAMGAAVALAAAPAGVDAQTEDELAVREVLELYLRSHATGEGEHVARAFHPQLVMYFYRNGEMGSRSAADYVAGHTGAPAADEALRRRWIAMVDITGTAASAKVVLDYPAVRFTDYFTLLKIGDEWKIMNKVFHSEPKAPGPDR